MKDAGGKHGISFALDDAVDEIGLFGNQNSACRLRDAKTIAVLEERFGLSTSP